MPIKLTASSQKKPVILLYGEDATSPFRFEDDEIIEFYDEEEKEDYDEEGEDDEDD